ncbi:MAG: hypothetical protein KAW47_10595 [Thermoplasmatales archaeon]|nr:hypothetical protein [Thermoplasmatales archaeon]
MNERIRNLIIVIALILLVVIIILVVIQPKPSSPLVVDAGGNGHYTCDIGGCINFNGKASGGVSPYNWSWDFNEDGIIDSYSKNPTYCYNDTNSFQYIINLTVKDKTGQFGYATALASIGLNLELGDILFMNIKPEIVDLFNITFNVHMAMYVGNNKFIESADYSISNKENMNIHLPNSALLKNGVQFSPKTWMKLVYENFTIGKVTTATPNQKQDAVDFAISQQDKPYQWYYESYHANPNITDLTNPFYEKYNYSEDPYIDYWYCSELVWASYLQQSIELDSMPNCIDYNPTPPPECFYWVGVDDLYHTDVRLFSLENWSEW